jgi:hypothetical protein
MKTTHCESLMLLLCVLVSLLGVICGVKKNLLCGNNAHLFVSVSTRNLAAASKPIVEFS